MTKSKIKPSRTLRWFAGCQETVLDLVPSERARYSGIGGVVLAVAIMAMISMGIALYMITGGYQWYMIFLLPVWGLFIISLDRWLVSTTTLAESGGLLGKLWPRILLSVALGVIVAEPLLLGIFKPGIEAQIKATRENTVIARESALARCNPLPGAKNSAAANSKECRDLRLVIDGESPEVVQEKLTTAKAQAEELKTTVNEDADGYAKLQDAARNECVGAPGRGNTGEIGDGPFCKHRRKQAEDFRRDHRVEENNQRLSELNGKIAGLTAELRTAQDDYGKGVKNAIQADLTKVRARQLDVGLAERFEAMHALASQSGYTAAAQWALRIFLIIVDAAPVLLKIVGGQSVYDRLIADRVRGAETVAQRQNETDDLDSEKVEEAHRHASDLWCDLRKKRSNDAYQKEFAPLHKRRGRRIAAGERRLLKDKDALGPRWARERT